MCQTHGYGRRTVTFRIGENDAKMDFVLIKKEH